MHSSNSCASSCQTSENELLLSILQQDAAITVRWSQVFQAGGIPPPAASVVPVTSNSCSSLRDGLLANILEQRRETFNAMFLAI